MIKKTIKKCVVKLTWEYENEDDYSEYIIMDLDLSKHRESSVYSQIYNFLYHEGPTFDKYDWQEITI
tara:strand:- start:1555 stop:1755 length:201 start_codon:yes stop_codon:yes gene_type:complete